MLPIPIASHLDIFFDIIFRLEWLVIETHPWLVITYTPVEENPTSLSNQISY